MIKGFSVMLKTFQYFSVKVLLTLSVFLLLGLQCSSKPPLPGDPSGDLNTVPGGSNRGTGNIIDIQAVSGEAELGQGDLFSISVPNDNNASELTNVKIDKGTLIFTTDLQEPLNTQQINELEASFKMWVAEARPEHRNNPSIIAIGDPDFTWDIATKEVTEAIYDLEEVTNFKKSSGGDFSPVTSGNYTAFIKIILEDSTNLVRQDAFISIKDVEFVVDTSAELRNDATLFEPTSVLRSPIILRFEATPSNIRKGEVSTLRWWVAENPTTLNIDNGVGNVANLVQRNVSPQNTTTYTLTIANSKGSDSRQVTVNVVP